MTQTQQKAQLIVPEGVSQSITAYQATVIKAALKAHLKGIMVNRTYTRKNMLRTAGTLLGRVYKSSTAEVERAIKDLEEALA
jgi:hypothetical protein